MSSSRRFGSPAATITHGSLLTDIAREFGYARSRTGRADALRSGVDVTGMAAFDSDVLPGKEGGPRVYDPKLEPHTLGSVLVSAVFEAFTTIVRRKTERFYRIAGLNRDALDRVPLSDALVKAIAQEACDVAGQFLNICIRAIDYCPPADMELGEYLRAIITADGDRRAHRQVGLPRSADAVVPAAADLSRPRALHDRRRRALAAARRVAAREGARVPRSEVRG